MYLAWHALATYGVAGVIVPHIAELAVLVVVATIAGRSLLLDSWKDILPYSFFWVFTIAILDGVMNIPLVGAGFYADWNLWIGYALILLVPLAAPQTRSHWEDAAHVS